MDKLFRRLLKPLYLMSSYTLFWKVRNSINLLKFKFAKTKTETNQDIRDQFSELEVIGQLTYASIFNSQLVALISLLVIFNLIEVIFFHDYYDFIVLKKNALDFLNSVKIFLSDKFGNDLFLKYFNDARYLISTTKLKITEINIDIFGYIASSFIALVTVYFATVSIVFTNSYANSLSNIRHIIWTNKFNRSFLKYYIYLVALIFIFSSLNLFNYQVGFIVQILLIILSIIGILGFPVVVYRTFNFLSPVYLVTSHFIPEIRELIKKVTIDGEQWDTPAIQNYHQRQAEDFLTKIENIIFVQYNSDKGASEDDIETIVKNLLELLFFYSLNKAKIPNESYWFKQKNEHKEWFNASYSELQIALEANIGLQYNLIHDQIWFETRLFKILSIIFKNIYKNNYFLLAITALKVSQNYIQQILEKAEPKTAYIFIEWIFAINKNYISKIKPNYENSEKYLIEENVTLPISLIEHYSMFPIILSLGLLNRIEKFNIHSFKQKISEIRWELESDIYSTGFPQEIIDKLKFIRKRLLFELHVEGEIISPQWYIQQISLEGVFQFFNEIPKTVLNTLNNEYISFVKKLIEEKNHLMALELLSRGFEAYQKAYNLADSLESSLTQFRELISVKDLPHTQVDCKNFHEQLDSFHKKLAEHYALLSTITYQLPDNIPLPDFQGEIYWRISDECLKCIIRNDYNLFAKIFPMHFINTFSLFEKCKKKMFNASSNNQDFWTIQNMDIIIDIFSLCGYALVYKELGQVEIWSEVEKVWDKAFLEKILDNGDVEAWLQGIVSFATGRNLYSLVASNRQYRQYSWQSFVSHDLANKNIIRERSYGSSRNVHNNKILDLVSESAYLGFSRYGADDIFIAIFFRKYLIKLDDSLGREAKEVLRRMEYDS